MEEEEDRNDQGTNCNIPHDDDSHHSLPCHTLIHDGMGDDEVGGEDDAQSQTRSDERPNVGNEVEQSCEKPDQKGIGDPQNEQSSRDNRCDDGDLGSQADEVAREQRGGIFEDAVYPFGVLFRCQGLNDVGKEVAVLQEEKSHEGNAEQGHYQAAQG